MKTKFEIAEELLGTIAELEADGVHIPNFDACYEALLRETEGEEAEEKSFAEAVKDRISFCEEVATSSQEEESRLIKEIAILYEWQSLNGYR